MKNVKLSNSNLFAMLPKALGLCMLLFAIFPSFTHANNFVPVTKPVNSLEKEGLAENPKKGKKLIAEFTSVFEKSVEIPKVEVEDIDDDYHTIASLLSHHVKGSSTNNAFSLYSFDQESRKLFILFCSLRIHLV